jgi:hypothetical protein
MTCSIFVPIKNPNTGTTPAVSIISKPLPQDNVGHRIATPGTRHSRRLLSTPLRGRHSDLEYRPPRLARNVGAAPKRFRSSGHVANRHIGHTEQETFFPERPATSCLLLIFMTSR